MAQAELHALVAALGRTRALLEQHGDLYTTKRLHDLETRLNGGDTSAIVSAVSEATGGTGSLNDRFLRVQNGDAIEPTDVPDVNDRLRELVREVEQHARIAAATFRIPLVR